MLISNRSALAQLPIIESPPQSNLDSPTPNTDSVGADSLTNLESQSLTASNPLPSEVRNQLGLADTESANTSPEIPVTNTTPSATQPSLTSFLSSPTDQLTSPEGLTSSIKVALILATLSLAPAIVLMTTCYVRVIVVLTLLKQAFGAQQLPPTQVLTALSLFVTLLIMTPVWTEVKQEAIDPYTQAENGISWEEAWTRGIAPVKTFMAKQIEAAGNAESIAVFYKYVPEYSEAAPTSAQDVPINVLLPAFMVSELKVAFLLGFQIFLPFLVLDLVVSSVTVSTGMLMLPPTMVSFPLKLILFVLVDGWNLVVGMLLQSFIPIT
jgi:flagellar biosynthetic protein FliP